ncbi:MAG: insulinase family protein, partial [Thermonemataceae bacterium]|nr:insulinase family protein [Thermonemataceae bacterium]
ATEEKNLEKANQLIFREIHKLKKQALSYRQLEQLKQQIMGQIAMAEENNMNFMLMMGKSMLDMNKVESLKEVFAQIEAIQSTDLLEVANEIFDENMFSTLTYLPE